MNSPTLEDAIELATRAHEGQRDKADAPYIEHPLRVMAAVASLEEKMVAVLHDVVEDSPITLQQLRELGYPEAVVVAVDHLTRREGESYEDFVERAAANLLARRVKTVDLLDNMQLTRIASPTVKDENRLERYRRALKKIEELNAQEAA